MSSIDYRKHPDMDADAREIIEGLGDVLMIMLSEGTHDPSPIEGAIAFLEDLPWGHLNKARVPLGYIPDDLEISLRRDVSKLPA